MFRARNLPASLRPVVEGWDKKGMRFYVGPENLFSFRGKTIRYLANPDISSRPGSWHAVSEGFTYDQVPQLTSEQVGNVATRLATFFRPQRFVLLVDYRCNYRCPLC